MAASPSTPRPCTRCAAPGITEPDRLCDPCIIAITTAERAAQGLPAVVPADHPVWAELDAALTPVHPTTPPVG